MRAADFAPPARDAPRLSNKVAATSPVGFVGLRGWFWTFIASWFVPVIMTIAYLVLALTSETDATGWAWMSIGLAFVFCLWGMFRALARAAAMSRAIGVGDAGRVVELGGGSPLYRGVAHALRAEWPLALAALAEATPKSPRDKVLVATVTIGALVETREVAKARDVLDRALAADGPMARLHPRLDAASHIAARLARGRVLTAEHSNAEALAVLQQVIDDIRTDSASRALAHFYAGRVAADAGDIAGADNHRVRAAALAPGAWFTSAGERG